MASLTLPRKSNVYFALPTDASFQRQDSVTKVDLLLLGIPRITSFSANLPSSSTKVVERFMRDFGLDDGHPNYQLEIKSGKLISPRYILIWDRLISANSCAIFWLLLIGCFFA
ncbi:MAG: hypothetical protein AAB116_09635 [Candidatus Poribacteria bacterium]